MGYQGVALLLAAVIGFGMAAYHYYTQNTAQTYGSQRSRTYVYVPPEEAPAANNRKRKSSNSDKCSICQETLTGHIRNLQCQHSFHKECIEHWFKESRTCPVCRGIA